ncbi:flagellar basal body P-ring formation chaperone FlgA [Pedomonas mirosovicensis]|uniref:flagellar basal body P-ring formation chaperone FlgA n=1 Tax=Pedomonas mirosovicensis TaxID=2908641 RepID=UPI002169C07D|nr:flagellar basal body P-ring formation chaperone FlgA [Pedomonas mirosovicensis]MCH8685101.1 flagellar basal body P-ring formation chaperone FlgA [Pedomonas mirosovicensis]
MTRIRTLAFVASLVAAIAPAAPAVAATQPEMVEIAVLTNRVGAGEIITASDLEVRTIDARKARGALMPAEVAGLEARRSLSPGNPVRSYDLRQPTLIRKGQAVAMVVSHGGLTIAAKGKALEDGGKGDIVRVQNISSQRVIQGEVTAEGVVSVSTGGLAMLAGL